jgi:uncharacterized protein YdeI (YjbR/CyaY-like superfamily)
VIHTVRRRVDDTRFVIRFTPRQPRSIWSAVNIERMGELAALGLMLPPGEAAFAARDEARSKVYSFEQRDVTLADARVQQLRADEAARRWFQTQPASYEKLAVWWVMSARREETRAKRLATLIAECAAGRRLEQFTKWSRN